MHEAFQRQLFSRWAAALALALALPAPALAGPADDELRAARLIESALLASPQRTKTDADKLIGIYGQLAARYPNHAGIRNASANFLWSEDRRAEAMAQWQKAQQLEPSNAEAAYHLGACLLALGRIREANEQFERAVTLAPGDALYHYNLATASFLFRHQIGGPDSTEGTRRAMEHFRVAAGLDPFNTEYAKGYAETFYALPAPDWREALAAWQHVLEISPNPDFAYVQLARVSLHLREKEKARDYLARIRNKEFEHLKSQLLKQANAP